MSIEGIRFPAVTAGRRNWFQLSDLKSVAEIDLIRRLCETPVPSNLEWVAEVQNCIKLWKMNSRKSKSVNWVTNYNPIGEDETRLVLFQFHNTRSSRSFIGLETPTGSSADSLVCQSHTHPHPHHFA
jgi:hypothetical protein